ncbi:MAG: DEAD/DEAH box helicase [Epibacterium sp.]|nr:DEAD/DEAH box helicase [Epibacterium sp.]NQX73907.1 DEAD/DEAH box helicase [Epibacterium sp.]
MRLRPYQQEAHDAAWNVMRRSLDPVVIEAATGAGKSHIIAALADTVLSKTGKRVLCLAPSAELVTQNHAKYLAAGHKAGIYSASAGQKTLRHPVTFGTPGTVKGALARLDDRFGCVVIDECHGTTPTIRSIVNTMREANPNLRVVGLTATPYRLNEGYVYQIGLDGRAVPSRDDAMFTRLVYQIGAQFLIDQGFLTPPTVGGTDAHYDTSGLALNKRGQFDAGDVDRAYHGHGRLTGEIVGDIVAQSQGRRGVLIFAATVQHAEEIMASLPQELSAIVTGKTPKPERKDILRRFLAQEIKYLVNVAVLTTGFDAPHVDVVAMLRRTESAALLQQIIGRGLRLYEGKEDCLLLDYAENLPNHFPDGDIFAPQIDVQKEGEAQPLDVICPECGGLNVFTADKNRCDTYDVDANGYCLDALGARVQTDHGPMPAHHGRRCTVHHLVNGHHERCGYRWTFKECPHCEAPNDIAARYCTACKQEIIDPNEKLQRDFTRFKRSPSNLQTDPVLGFTVVESVSRAGNPTLRVDFVTPWRSFSVWYQKDPKHWKAARDLETFNNATDHGQTWPRTVTYKKQDSGFYQVFGYNGPADTQERMAAE